MRFQKDNKFVIKNNSNMKILFFLLTMTFWSCKAQNNKHDLSLEEYKVVNAVLDDYRLNKFLLDDENYHYNLTHAFKVYVNWYIKYLETGKSTLMASKDIEWILNGDDIGNISLKIEYDSAKIKWDKNKLNRSEILYASNHPELVTSTEVPRLGLIKISKPYLNKDKNKAVIFIITDSGYLVLVKKVRNEWQVCGKIEYMFS